MKTKYVIYALLIIALGSLVAYRISKNNATATAGNRGAGGPVTVEGVVLKPQSFSNSLSVSGSIQANEEVQIRSEVSGIVRGIYFKEGTNVSKGQVLLKINDTELQARLSQALTRQNLASETENRAGQLLKKEAISAEEYDISLADLRSLQAETQLIRAQLEKTQVRAPFSGKIGLRSISEGEYLIPTTAVATLVDINPVKITFSIPEKYSGQIKNTASLTFTVAGLNKKYKAQVYAIEPGINTTTRTLQLRARADNPTGELLSGSFANVVLPLSVIDSALLVPTQAIIPVLKGKKVFITKNGLVEEVMIETSARTEKDVLVTSGLNAGDTVLTTGTMSVKPEMPVRVKVVNK